MRFDGEQSAVGSGNWTGRVGGLETGNAGEQPDRGIASRNSFSGWTPRRYQLMLTVWGEVAPVRTGNDAGGAPGIDNEGKASRPGIKDANPSPQSIGRVV
jgi:hypothetical protein